MSWVDVAIVVVLAASALGGIAQGVLRAACSLLGFLLGLTLAVWNYASLAAVFKPIVRVEAVANAIGFLVIALLVMALFNLFGVMLNRTIRWMGLGCLDKMAGAVFGLLQGALLVMVCILITVAFYPRTHWLAEARLPQLFFGACHLSTHMTPSELSDRVRSGLQLLEHASPQWMHPPKGV